MSGNQQIFLRVEINKKAAISIIDDHGDFYIVHMGPHGITSPILEPFFQYMIKTHSAFRSSIHEDAPSEVDVDFAWMCDELPDGIDPFDAVCTILNAIAAVLPINSVALLSKRKNITNFLDLLLRLPLSVKKIAFGLCDATNDSVPAHVWESRPCLQSIHVTTNRVENGSMCREIEILRPKAAHPRDDEPETADKRVRTEVVDFATSTAKAFVVLAFEDEDDRAETFQIAVERPVKFRAIPFEEIPSGVASSLIDAPVASYSPAPDLQDFISVVYATTSSVKRCDVKPNILASVVAGVSIWGRAIFVKK